MGKIHIAQSRQLVPNEVTYFGRNKGDPFHSDQSDVGHFCTKVYLYFLILYKDHSDSRSLSSAFAIPSMARKLSKQVRRTRAVSGLDAVKNIIIWP